jgi:hypothetical protein
MDDQVSLLGSRSPSPISSLSLSISFSVEQKKARKINERKKEEKGKKDLVAKKKEECWSGVGTTRGKVEKKQKEKVGIFSFYGTRTKQKGFFIYFYFLI